ncbi:MAG: YceI family protein [Solirubrobacterales bacterium]|nr:YceI family protein [Solirubrobacterales bacterium]MBV9474033.1 YceI family protein [Solirubrobacterales bacterium]
MSIPPGAYTFGPHNATLLVNTGRAGAAAKAGHDLVIEVRSWSGTLELGEAPEDSRVTVDADGGSLTVRAGTGGIQALGEDDKSGIKQTIDDEVLKRSAVQFRSSSVQVSPDREQLRVHGELELSGRRAPLSFELAHGSDGRLTGSARFKQSEVGIKPYTTLFGALKVADAVEVTIDAALGSD